MSTIIMAACWPLQGMTPSQKAVLISLADQANDDGVCWPAVKTISRRTCLSERAVQGAIRWLANNGILRIHEREGRSTVYTVTPAAYAPQQEMRPADAALTPADTAPPPPQMLHHPPADAAPRTINEPSVELTKEPQVTTGQILPAVPTGQVKAKSTAKPKEIAPSSRIWNSYQAAYSARYGVDPVRNAKVNGQLTQLLARLGEEEAIAVASWFIGHNDRWYVSRMHSVDCLLRDCEKLRTEWATGRTMTQRQATEADRRQSTGNMASSLADRLRAQGHMA